VTEHREWADQVLKGSAEPRVVVVMGATGAGKTTVGARLARTLGWMYVETDNLLSTEDFNKAIRGAPLTETVLETWLDKISVLIGKYVDKKQSVVLACSALREAYRQRLQGDERVRWVYLRGTYQQLEERQKKRQSRLPYLARLAYESKLLEEPQDSLVVDISWSPQEIVDTILSDLK
jgi:gluconokinase